MKQIPNIITSVRLVCALILIGASTLTRDHAVHCFLLLFIMAGISDMLDGFIARRFNWCTDFGAKLDSVSDLALYASVGLFLWINATAALSSCGSVMLLGAAVQIFHLCYSFRKFRQFPAYHTDYTRLCAYAIFFGIIAFWTTRSAEILPLLALIWTSCSIEGITITLLLQKPMSNLHGIFEVLSMRKAVDA